MAKVTIGGRALDVRPRTLGFVRTHLLPWKKKMRETTTDEEVHQLTVAGFLMFLDHNVGVDEAFILDNVNEDDVARLFREVMAAAGVKETAAGEAKGP